MIVKKNLIDQLKTLGLNSYEVKMWTALLSKGSAGVGELSELSDVPRSRAYDVLESLEKKGFIVMHFGKPIKYTAVHPDEVIERLKIQVKKDAEEKVKFIDQFKDSDVMKEIKNIFNITSKKDNLATNIVHLRNKSNVFNQLNSLIKEAKERIIFVLNSDFAKELLFEFYDLLEKKKNIVKFILHSKDLEDRIPFYKTTTNKIKSNFIVIDDKVILSLDDKIDTMLLINSDSISYSLNNLLNSLP